MKYYRKSKRGSQPVTAMATVNPQLCRQSGIRVEVIQSGEGPAPHVHVYREKGKAGECSCISLTEPKYAVHHSVCVRLTRHERDEFANIMSSVWDKYFIELRRPDEHGNSINRTYTVKATGYEAAVMIWCDTYADSEKYFHFDTEGRPLMPDYSRLPLSGKEY